MYKPEYDYLLTETANLIISNLRAVVKVEEKAKDKFILSLGDEVLVVTNEESDWIITYQYEEDDYRCSTKSLETASAAIKFAKGIISEKICLANKFPAIAVYHDYYPDML